MLKAADLAANILDEARAHIQANMAQHYRTINGERWVNASGRSSAAFQVERGTDSVKLIYRGDDVAPLSSIEYGTEEVPSLEEAERWREDKIKSGATNVPSAKAIVRSIELNGGTERYREPQEWIISPVIETAVLALHDQLRGAALEDIKFNLFQN